MVELPGRKLWVDLFVAQEQIYLYIGDDERRLDNLQLLLQTGLQPEPLRRIIEERAQPAEDVRSITESIGLALARRTKGPVFYAYNLSISDPKELMEVMGGLKKAIIEKVGVTESA
jgi:hypothetical protein